MSAGQWARVNLVPQPATNPDPAVGDNPQSVALGDVDGDGVEPAETLQVLVFGNPTQSETVEVEIRGAGGQALQLTVVSAKGTLVSDLTVNRAGAIERQTVQLGSEAGVYLLTISTSTHRQTVKIVRQ